MRPGDAIGRYRIEAELGRGGMGVVYRAIDPELDRPVALKVIRLPPDASAELREELEKRFRREAKAAARIRHPGVVAIHDVGVTGTDLFLVMELVEGESLAARLERGAFMPRAAALDLAARAAEALGAAHRAGVVHRDVKPANILLAADGRVLLTDFGVARSLDEVSELTRTGMVVGSPAYMAPEQLQGMPVDGRADLFSLGVVLYELLLRKRPFPAQSITTLLYQILHEDPLADPSLAHELDATTAGVLRRLLAKPAGERFPDASTAAAAIRAVPMVAHGDEETLPGAVGVGAPAAPVPRVTQPLATHPTPPAAFVPSPGELPPPPRAPVASPPRSIPTWVWLGGGLALAAAGLAVLVALLAWRQATTPSRPTVATPAPVAMWDPAAVPPPEPSYAVTGTPEPVATASLPAPPLPTPAMAALPVAERETQRSYAAVPREPEPQSERVAAVAGPADVPVAAAPPPVAPPAPPPVPAIHEDHRFVAQRGFEMEIDPEEAEVWVDGRSHGAAMEWDGRPPLQLPAGRHLVRLTHPGYQPVLLELTVVPGDGEHDEVTEVEIDLEEVEEP
jgi:serine/threonine-protein kinase